MIEHPAQRKRYLRAKGNLNYLQFIRLVQHLWNETHPDIPIVASGNDEPAHYPCLVYSLQLRKPVDGEPKPKIREQIDDQENAYIISAQRFQNIVFFSAVGEAQDVDAVEELIEVFEDFMMEFLGVFKECGVSELTYSRRLSDSEENRPGAGAIRRTIAFSVVTEKVISTQHDRLEKFYISARTWLDKIRSAYEPGTIYNNRPRYHLVGPDAVLKYEVTQESIDNAGTFEDLEIRIPKTYFRIGDTLYLLPYQSNPEIYGFYTVTNIPENPYAIDGTYTLQSKNDRAHDMSRVHPGIGGLVFIPDNIEFNLIDDFESATPDWS